MIHLTISERCTQCGERLERCLECNGKGWRYTEYGGYDPLTGESWSEQEADPCLECGRTGWVCPGGCD